MRRSAILGLFLAGAVTAVGMMALRNANPVWLGIVLLATVGALALSVVGSVQSAGWSRAWWFGYATFGWIYFAFAFAPGLSDKVQPRLATTNALDYLHAEVVAFTRPMRDQIQELQDIRKLLVRQIQMMEYIAVKDDGHPGLMELRSRLRNLDREIERIESPNGNWRAFLKGAVDRDHLVQVGHCLATLLAGLIGGMASVSFRAGRSES